MLMITLRRNSEFRQAEEQENHILPKKEEKQPKLNRPKLKIEVIRSVFFRNNKKTQKEVVEQRTTVEEFVEEELDQGMSL